MIARSLVVVVQERQTSRPDEKQQSTVEKIRKVLELIRDHFEVPFIAYYRKRCFEPELVADDLWRIYQFDAKWTDLNERKRKLSERFVAMQKYQCALLADGTIRAEDERILRDEDIARLSRVESPEVLKDVSAHFHLYYGHLVAKMQRHRTKMNNDINLKKYNECYKVIINPN